MPTRLRDEGSGRILSVLDLRHEFVSRRGCGGGLVKTDLMATQQISCAQGREKLMISFGSPCASNNCALSA
jgi:hypothetical protein